MKRLLLISVLIVFVILNSIGQVEKPITKGHFITGGTIGFEMKETSLENLDEMITKYTPEMKITTDTYLGYFIFNQFASGLKVDYTLFREKYIERFNIKYEYFILEPFIRYYFSFGLFGESSIGYGFSKYDDQLKEKLSTWNLGVGYSIFLNEKLAIEPVIYYEVIKITETHPLLENQIEKKYGLNFQVGIQLYFDFKNE